MGEETKANINLKAGLAAWAKKYDVRPTDFAQKMGYTGAYGWSLLRGEATVTVTCLGQFVLSYGSQAADELLSLAGVPNDADQRTAAAAVQAPTLAEDGQFLPAIDDVA